jgi:hypothetical protein
MSNASKVENVSQSGWSCPIQCPHYGVWPFAAECDDCGRVPLDAAPGAS